MERAFPVIWDDCLLLCERGPDGTFAMIPQAEIISLPASWRRALWRHLEQLKTHAAIDAARKES